MKLDMAVVGLCTLVELGCITALAAIGLKRNNDCYKAEMELLDCETKLIWTEIDVIRKDAEIKELKKELEGLKGEEES